MPCTAPLETINASDPLSGRPGTDHKLFVWLVGCLAEGVPLQTFWQAGRVLGGELVEDGGEDGGVDGVEAGEEGFAVRVTGEDAADRGG
jgi:hypothetical protein